MRFPSSLYSMLFVGIPHFVRNDMTQVWIFLYTSLEVEKYLRFRMRGTDSQDTMMIIRWRSRQGTGRRFMVAGWVAWR